MDIIDELQQRLADLRSKAGTPANEDVCMALNEAEQAIADATGALSTAENALDDATELIS